MKRLFLFLLVHFCFFVQSIGLAQNKRLIDSLQIQLKKLNSEQSGKAELKDSTVALTLYQLSLAYADEDPTKSMDYARQMMAWAEKIGFKRGLGNANFMVGRVLMNNGDYTQSLKYLNEALRIRIEIGDKNAIAKSYGNIGVLYDLKGNLISEKNIGTEIKFQF